MIAEILSAEPIHNFTIFALAFYLHILYFRSLGLFYRHAKERVLQLRKDIAVSKNGLDEIETGIFHLELFKENEEVFREIMPDILTGSYEQSPEADRMPDCTSVFSSVNHQLSKSSSLSQSESVVTIMAVVNNQPGLEKNTTAVILLFCEKLLTKPSI